jgi:predicted patatin/cPLA2 family phospholipase
VKRLFRIKVNLVIFYKRLYYDEKSRWNMQMEAQKSRIDELENALNHSKVLYKEAMNNLSKISEEVRKQLISINVKFD